MLEHDRGRQRPDHHRRIEVDVFSNNDLELKFVMALREFGVGCSEVCPPVAFIGLVDEACCAVCTKIILHQGFGIFVHHLKKGVIEEGNPVGEVVASYRKQFSVRVREDVQPRFVRDFLALIPDVEESG